MANELDRQSIKNKKEQGSINLKKERESFLRHKGDASECNQYLNILNRIEQIFRDEYGSSAHPFPFTKHDPTHCENVELNIYELIPKSKFSSLSCREKFLLLSAVWLHDIGMIPTLFHDLINYKDLDLSDPEIFPYIDDLPPNLLDLSLQEGQDYVHKIRENHAKRSEIYVLHSYNIDELKDLYMMGNKIKNNFKDDIRTISFMCSLHPLKSSGNKANERLEEINNNYWEQEEIRLPLLIAYLRIADTLHIPDKGNNQEFLNFLAWGPDTISKFHWFKSKYTNNVLISPESHSVRIVNKIPCKPPNNRNSWEEIIEPLQKMITKEIRDELDSVKDILCRGGISFFSRIETDCIDDIDFKDDFQIWEYQQVLKNIDLLFDTSKTPSSSLIVGNIVKTLNLLLNTEDQRFSQPTNITIRNLANFYNNVIIKVMEERSKHALLVSIKQKIEQVLKTESPDDLKGLKYYVKNWDRMREEDLKLLAESSFEILKLKGPILLYGYSDTVLKCIEYFIKKSNDDLILYVCEVRPKTEYRYNNRLVFSDGLANIKSLKEINLKYNTERVKINYIPDIAVTHLFEEYRKKNKGKSIIRVLLGTNSIDKDGNITHTVGVRMIADAAFNFNIPVYVVAESTKYLNENVEIAPKEFRKGWLTKDNDYLKILEGCKNYNPREDQVPLDKITAFITENGIVFSEEINAGRDLKYAIKGIS